MTLKAETPGVAAPRANSKSKTPLMEMFTMSDDTAPGAFAQYVLERRFHVRPTLSAHIAALAGLGVSHV
jgi:hypothetical protein